jgi:hypothetical protein
MSYENAPATRMLATHCACCRRPLVDAKSVETGMGPVCRNKHGYNIEVSEQARVQANKLVYEVALEQSKAEPDRLAIVAKACTLHLLGFDKLAGIITKRTAEVRIEVQDNTLFVHTPYNEAATSAWRAIPGRCWAKDVKANRVPASQKRAVWELLRRFYAGCAGVGPRGAFQVEATP